MRRWRARNILLELGDAGRVWEYKERQRVSRVEGREGREGLEMFLGWRVEVVMCRWRVVVSRWTWTWRTKKVSGWNYCGGNA